MPISPVTSDPPTPAATAPAPRNALETVTDFFQAINQKDWPTVWALGGSNLGHSYQQMVAGYARTDRDDLTIYGDDGSLVRVAILARETSGVTQLYMGRYTVQGGAIIHGSLALEASDHGAGFGSFAGTWGGHGRNLEVTTGGLGVVSFRTYRSCSANLAPPCDAQDGDYIVDGGLTTFRLTSIKGDRATAQTIGGTGKARPTMNLQLDRTGNVMTITGFEGAPFCSAKAPANTCGA